MSLENDLDKLVENRILSPEKSVEIRDFLTAGRPSQTSRVLVAFGVLGAILVGLGIILIIAHNWDNFSRTIKTGFAFLPMVIGQVACGIVLFSKWKDDIWRECASTFLFFAIGACISLISQIYHIQGELSVFMLTWMLLVLPMVYLMRSAITSLLYLAGVTYFGVLTGYWNWSDEGANPLFYAILLPAILPFYFYLIRRQPRGNSTAFHHFFIPLSLIICLGITGKSHEEFLFLAYLSLFGIFYGLSEATWMQNAGMRVNPYRFFGAMGTIITLLIVSFRWFWEELQSMAEREIGVQYAPEFLMASILTLGASAFLWWRYRRKSWRTVKPLEVTFLVFLPIFAIGMKSMAAMALVNLLVLGLGILTVGEGDRRNHLGILNFGLLIITALIICRFFDTSISFVIRGLLFLLVGVGFFAANYRILKKRRTQDA